MKESDRLIISWIAPSNGDFASLAVARRQTGGAVDIFNMFTGQEAVDLYNLLTKPKQKESINDDTIAKIEAAFGFPLYDWQKNFLKGDNDAIPMGGRRNGRKFIFCVRLLLDDRELIDVTNPEVWTALIDSSNKPHYHIISKDYLLDINDKLVKAGFITNIKGGNK